MILEDFHIHTTFCDGKSTPEEMVQSAIALGLKRLGFSGHAPAVDDASEYTIRAADIPAYRAEITRLKEKYKKQITILCGIEQDLFSVPITEPYDYVIGSSHTVEGRNGKIYDVDDTPDVLKTAVEEGFDGDVYAYCENYFERVSRIGEALHPDIIGHFDLLTKFNEKYPLIDETHPRYVAAWQKALDALLPYGIPFEINSGAMSRNWRTTPYPAKPILQYIFQKGGRVVLNSDSHSAQTIAHCFELSEAIAKEVGFAELKPNF